MQRPKLVSVAARAQIPVAPTIAVQTLSVVVLVTI